MDKIRIHLENFKCFENNTFHLNNITFLTGANTAGKSSLIQALLLADSALTESSKENVIISLNNSERALDLGKVDNLINNAKGQDKVCIKVSDTEL